MRRGLWALALLAFGLQGCGNSPDRADLSVSLRALAAVPGAVLQREARVPATRPEGADLLVTWPARAYAAYFTRRYPARDGAGVWVSPSAESITLRDGLVVATRGLGPDIMASTGPSLAQVSAAQGIQRRVYEYLDGSDSAAQVDFDCTLSAGGSDQGLRLVVESCERPGLSFQNRYWFGPGGGLSRSEQMLTPGAAPLSLQWISG